MYDIIIVGGGIAGLYSAYKIKKQDSTKKILVLEANDHLGGRAGNYMFHGQSVTIGAGIGRKKKDKLLIKLLTELDIPYSNFMVSSQYASTIHPPCKLKEMFLYLKQEYDVEKDKAKTFKQFAKPKLDHHYGKDTYDYFVVCSGYTDYESECAYDTLYYYGFDDNYSDWPGMGLSWKQLIETLESKIGSQNIRKNCAIRLIKQISTFENTYELICDSNTTFLCKKVILATTIDSVRKLLPKKSIYKQIKGQHFLRMYGKFSKDSIPIMQEKCGKTTLVPGPIHKIIPMNTEKGIYMIAYTDNDGATVLENFKENTAKNRYAICRLLEVALDISSNSLELEDMVDFYWDIGTHYYTPIHGAYKNRKEFCYYAQRPDENMRIVGEMISMKQGWVEGALESVESIIDEFV